MGWPEPSSIRVGRAGFRWPEGDSIIIASSNESGRQEPGLLMIAEHSEVVEQLRFVYDRWWTRMQPGVQRSRWDSSKISLTICNSGIFLDQSIRLSILGIIDKLLL